jgi:hypothetical protein
MQVDVLPEAAGTSLLIVFESPPAGLTDAAGAVPVGSVWFDRAVRRYGVPPAMLAAAARVNALPMPPAGNWHRTAVRRVRAAIAQHRPRAIVAGGWVARDAVQAALRVPRQLAWLEPVQHDDHHIVAVPHFSGRCRLLNDRAMRAATAAAFQRAHDVALTEIGNSGHLQIQ